jgi:hypothetical protein
MGKMLTTHIPTALNPADLATKIIPGRIKRNSLLDMVMYDIASMMTFSAPSRLINGLHGFPHTGLTV